MVGMQKKNSIFLAVIIALAIGIGWYFFVSPNAASKTTSNDNGIVLYYSDSCPHCKNVEAFLAQENVRQKVTFAEKEVSKDQKNANELVERSIACGYPKDQIGVPMLWENGKCTVGDEPIIEYFKEKIK